MNIETNKLNNYNQKKKLSKPHKKCLNLIQWGLDSSPAKINILLILAKDFQKRAIKLLPQCPFLMKTRVSLKYLVSDCRLLDK